MQKNSIYLLFCLIPILSQIGQVCEIAKWKIQYIQTKEGNVCFVDNVVDWFWVMLKCVCCPFIGLVSATIFYSRQMILNLMHYLFARKRVSANNRGSLAFINTCFLIRICILCRDAIISRVTERILVASHTHKHTQFTCCCFFFAINSHHLLACISTFVRIPLHIHTIYMILVFIPAIIWKQKTDHKMEFLWYDVTIWHRQFNYSALKSTVIVVLICPDDWIVVRFGGFKNGFNQCTIDHMWVLHLIYIYMQLGNLNWNYALYKYMRV